MLRARWNCYARDANRVVRRLEPRFDAIHHRYHLRPPALRRRRTLAEPRVTLRKVLRAYGCEALFKASDFLTAGEMSRHTINH